MKSVVLLLILVLFFPVFSFSDEWTEAKYVYSVQIDGQVNKHYIKAADNPEDGSPSVWGSAGCPNAYYAYTDDNELLGQKDILSVVLLAKALNKPVALRGNCDSNGNYFRVNRVLFE